jgi:tetratricopeptide (TPR) repeat protein
VRALADTCHLRSRLALPLLAFLALAALVTPPRVEAQRAGEQARRLLDAGRAHYAELEYAEAVDALGEALRAAERDDAFRAEVLETLALTCFVMEREEAARDALRQLFALDPYYLVREPSGSPRVARFVEAVRGTLVRDAAIDPGVTVRSELPRQARADRAVEIAVVTASSVVSAEVVYRTDTSASWQRVQARGGDGEGRFVAELPALPEASEVSLYVEARDARRRVVARDAGPLAPIRLEVGTRTRGPERQEADLASEPWLWIVIGAVVVGAGVGIGVGVGLSSEGVPTGTLPPGRIELP